MKSGSVYGYDVIHAAVFAVFVDLGWAVFYGDLGQWDGGVGLAMFQDYADGGVFSVS